MSKKLRRRETSTGYRGSEDYIVTDDLRNSVNIAIALQKPLLIKGEPGTGKTMLAQSIADSLDKELIIWNIKSTTKAQEGLYVYDTVQRLYDSQFGEGDVANISQYIKLGKLGEAFISPEPVVLLIDEIDKADLEFPNDLLWELDQMSFYIPETKETVAAIHRPIVVITSNAEKELPDAFLRRCIFHYIEFPEPQGMERIIKVHHPNLEKRLLDQAMETFYTLRNVPNIQKKPSTSELIDWLQALVVGGINPNRIKQDLPFLGVLLKKNEDLDTLLNQLYGKTQSRSSFVGSSLNRYR
ncbi:MAG TPA: MoxR family ATPase [Gelria sp.]|jgi:MoxR-like ATPase|nr:MoxR family ATPase [Gelria sp.]